MDLLYAGIDSSSDYLMDHALFDFLTNNNRFPRIDFPTNN